MAPIALFVTRLGNHAHVLLASRLAGLAPNDLAGVANAFAFVGLGWTKTAELRRDLTDHGLVRTVDQDLRRLRRRQLDARRRAVLDGVREAQRELQAVRPHLGLEADAGDLELLLITLRHAIHHVLDERTRQAVQRPVVRLIRLPLDVQRVVGAIDRDAAGQTMRELALGTFHLHRVAIDRYGHAVRDGDRKFSDSRHVTTLLYQTTATSSPPVRDWRASRSDIRPLLVLRIASPSPLRTRGISAAAT